MIVLGLFWQLFESSIPNFIFLIKFYATFSLDYYWNSDLTFIVQQMLEKSWKKSWISFEYCNFGGKNRTKLGTALIETALTGESLYLNWPQFPNSKNNNFRGNRMRKYSSKFSAYLFQNLIIHIITSNCKNCVINVVKKWTLQTCIDSPIHGFSTKIDSN